MDILDDMGVSKWWPNYPFKFIFKFVANYRLWCLDL